ncbi:MAG: 2,3-cyclic-nucleotide 2-phosphodiesterase 5-nucleotidase [Cyanobacteria bacterium RYN_339]|nr:2,3-cyclic-nucleotide 2-phosphodiesterase 5-nucleotidase [Cyanobacteria bacterium RYN_339]
MLIDPKQALVKLKAAVLPAQQPTAKSSQGAGFGRDQFVGTRRQGFVTMSDGHSALDKLPQVATVVKAAREADPTTLVFYGGDAVIGTPYYPAGQNGVADMQALDHLGVASFVIGNHDLDGGYDNFVRLAKAANMPYTVANWDIQGELASLTRKSTDPFTGALTGQVEKQVQPYRVFTNPVTGLKTVAIGVSVDPKEYGMLDPRITYRDPAETLRTLIPQIKADPDLADALIVVQTHLGAADAEKLEKEFGDTVFFAAHDHTPIALPVLEHVNGELSAVTDTGGNYRSPGMYHADVSAGGKLEAFEGGLVPIDKTVPADAGMLEALKPVQAIVDRDYNTPLAELKAPILRAKLPDAGDSAMGNWIVDQVKAAADAHLAAQGLAPTDLALINATGIRTDFPTPGKLTAGDVYKVFPFDNSITVVTLTADQLKAALDNAAKRAGDPIAGVTADISTEGASAIMVNGAPLGAQPTYRVATLDFMANRAAPATR